LGDGNVFIRKPMGYLAPMLTFSISDLDAAGRFRNQLGLLIIDDNVCHITAVSQFGSELHA
jgi:hypothetical protein